MEQKGTHKTSKALCSRKNFFYQVLVGWKNTITKKKKNQVPLTIFYTTLSPAEKEHWENDLFKREAGFTQLQRFLLLASCPGLFHSCTKNCLHRMLSLQHPNLNTTWFNHSRLVEFAQYQPVSKIVSNLQSLKYPSVSIRGQINVFC